MPSDVRIWDGVAWVSLKGPTGDPGPSAVSTNAGQLAKLGTDSRVLVSSTDLDARYVNVTGDNMTGTLCLNSTTPATEAPAAKLVIVGANQSVSSLAETNTKAAVSIRPNVASGFTLAIGATLPANNPYLQGVNFNGGGAAAPLSIQPYGGNVGIGKAANPLYTLDVAGTVGITGNITATGTAHSFAANSIASTAISGLPAAATVAPLANAAAAAVGTSTAYARQDHVHQLPTAAQVGAITQAQADARYVELAGDWMSGPLALGGSASFTTTAPLDIDATTYRLRQPKTPASQTDIGEQGTVCWDTAYLYCCVAPNQWRRQAWSDWSGAVTGAAWSPLATSTPPLFNVSYGGGVFVADQSKWSPDGSNWYAGTGLPAGNTHSQAAFGNGTFVTVNTSSGVPYTSPDGRGWVNRALGATGSGGRHCVGFGGGRFVAVMSTSGTSTGNVTPYYSVDGITWAASAAPAGLVANTLSRVTGVAHSGGASAGLFVAVGGTGSNGATATNRYLTSPDGVTWTARSLPLTSGWNDVGFGNGRFIAISPGIAALTSVDGINWAQVNMPASADWETITFGGGRWMAVAPSTATAAISSDGITWTTLPLPTVSAWNGVATNGTIFVATNGGTSPAILTPTPQLVTYFPITASRTLVSSDNNATVANVTTTAAPVTLTIPTNAALAFPIGTSITVMDASSTAATTIKADAGVTLNWSGKLVGTNATVLGGVAAEVQIPGPLSQVVLRKTAVDSWTILY